MGHCIVDTSPAFLDVSDTLHATLMHACLIHFISMHEKLLENYRSSDEWGETAVGKWDHLSCLRRGRVDT